MTGGGGVGKLSLGHVTLSLAWKRNSLISHFDNSYRSLSHVALFLSDSEHIFSQQVFTEHL